MATVQIRVEGRDRVGLVAAIAGRLFDLGFNLGDTAFSVLGTGFEFSTVADLPEGRIAKEVERELQSLPALSGCIVQVRPFTFEPVHADTGRATHRIRVTGGDQPGLLARLTETFVDFQANVVRLHSERIPDARGARYATQIDVAIPAGRTEACLAAIANTAEQLHLDCTWVALAPLS
ncbi:MAG: amino acid-binding protein [Alphaproteobacteria bacterium]|nr:amino acid-binding protein [Alphaproteobacteria bacterium]